MNRMRFLRIFILAVCAAMLTLVCVHWYMARNPGTSVEYWKFRMWLVGAERAHEELAASLADVPLILQHRRAHNFGAALYARLGPEGASVCDRRFFYGCFHQLIGEAVAEYGVSASAHIADVCERTLPDPSACMHSIGHGLLDSSGYTQHGLGDALRTCAPLSDPRGFCASGVFMEYNLRTMLQPEEDVRPLEPGNTYAVCDDLSNPSERETLWCIFWLPTWWAANHVSYPEQGVWCRRYSGAQLGSCIEGIGKMTVFAVKPSARFTAAACSSATVERGEYVACVSAAAYELAFSGLHEEAQQTCAVLTNESEAALCAQYAAQKRMTPDVDE